MEYQPKDYINQLAEYIKKNLLKGYTLDSLKFSLINQGYSRISVDNAVEVANKQLASEIPPIKEKPQITYKVVADNPSSSQPSVYPEKKGFLKRLFKK